MMPKVPARDKCICFRKFHSDEADVSQVQSYEEPVAAIEQLNSQDASHQFTNLVEAKDIVLSMSRKGECWDKSIAESFFATIKRELIFGINGL